MNAFALADDTERVTGLDVAKEVSAAIIGSSGAGSECLRAAAEAGRALEEERFSELLAPVAAL